jgi:3-oxoadipate enol-lactonase
MLFQIQGRRVHYDLIGDNGAPVVFMVHAMMADGSMWSEQVEPLLEAGFRVLRMDLPGHGGSEASSTGSTAKDLANDIVALLDELALAKVHYCGLSVGGIIGQAMAIHHPNRLLSLFLADTAVASPPGARDMWAERLKLVLEAGSLAPLADVTMGRVVTPAFKEKNLVLWSGLRNTILATQPLGLAQCAHAIEDFDFSQLLPKVRIPTLVVCGDGDPATPPAEGRRIASLIPGARYAEISNTRHYPNVEQPQQFNGALIEWLKSQSI